MSALPNPTVSAPRPSRPCLTSSGRFARLLVDDPLDLRPASLALRLLILLLVSFVMLWLGDKLNSSGMALTRYMATKQAPLTAAFYPTAAREQISVLMYDPQFLAQNTTAWPISYMDHGDWLLRLAANPAARPRAIFLDITFGQARDDPSLPSLVSAVCELTGTHGVPVFLAALASPEDGRLRVRPEIEAAKLADGKPCVTLVGVGYAPDPVDHQAWSYPLSTHLGDAHLGDAQWRAGPSATAPSFRSAAMTLAEDVGGIDLGDETEPMAVIWGSGKSGLPNDDHQPALLSYCRNDTFKWTQLVPKVLRQFGEPDELPAPCPIHRTLSMAQLGSLPDEALLPYLHQRYVMVGAAIPGHNDLVNSPVHGVIPGIYLHAMALDNLLTYRGKYKQNSEWSLPPSAELFLAGLMAITLVFAIHVAAGALRARMLALPFIRRHAPFLVMDDAARQRAGFCVRLCHAPFQVFAWLLRLSTQAVLALLLITGLQMWFRIGMLPVTELIGMTLLAEGLGYLEKVRDFIGNGAADTPPADPPPTTEKRAI